MEKKIGIACDHAAYELKEFLVGYLGTKGFEVGITGWERFDGNPIVTPDAGMWDGDACYKPSFLWNEDTKQWMLWYNGRNEIDEFIGVVFCDERKLF